MTLTRRAARSSGFTLVELVTIIVLIGIITAIAGPSFFDNRAFSERGYIDEIASSLRYTQRIAIASNCPVRFIIQPGGYAAFQQSAAGGTCNAAGAWNLAVRRTDGGNIAGAPPADVVVVQNITIEFDPDGSVTNGVPPALVVGPFSLNVSQTTGAVTITP